MGSGGRLRTPNVTLPVTAHRLPWCSIYILTYLVKQWAMLSPLQDTFNVTSNVLPGLV